MRKPYSRQNAKSIQTGRARPIIIQSGDNPHWLLVALSSLSLLVTPILVAIIASNANQSSTNKDYVSLAVNILNAKGSTPENRKWALRLLSKMSPVPFSEESENQLANGSGLTNELKIVPMFGPNNPLIKTDTNYIQPCEPVVGPAKAWSDKDVHDYVLKLGKAYRNCAINQQYSVKMLDVMQNTDKTKAQISRPIDAKKYPIYNLK